jgi:hypothetical protein
VKVFAQPAYLLNMFFGLRGPSTFLPEVNRMAKPEGLLILDEGHPSRQATLPKIQASGYGWVAEESRDQLKCRPVS